MADVEVTVSEEEETPPIENTNGNDAANAHAERARDSEEDAKEAATEAEEAAEESTGAAEVATTSAVIASESAVEATEAVAEVNYTVADLMAAIDRLGSTLAQAVAPPPAEEDDALISIEEAPPVEADKPPSASHWYRKPLFSKRSS